MVNYQNINVLYCPSDNSATSGAFLQMIDMICKIRYQGVNPLVVLPCKKGTGEDLLIEKGIPYVIIPSLDWVIPQNCSIYYILKKLIKIVKKNIKAVFKLVKLINERNINIIHVNTIWTFVGAIAALLTKRKLVWHIREAIEPAVSLKLMFRSCYNLINKSNVIISISQSVLDAYPYIDKTKSKVVYDGIDETRFIRDRKDLFSDNIVKLVCVGEIYKQKGQYDLINACKMLLDNNIKNWCLTVIGNGEIDKLKSEVNTLGLSNYINVIGPKKDIHNYLLEADIGIAPSHFEGFGRVAVEVTLSKCLLVCSRAGAFNEIYDDKKTAIMHDVKSSKSIYEALVYAIKNPIECKKIANEGFNNSVNKYTADINANMVYEVYKDIIK